MTKILTITTFLLSTFAWGQNVTFVSDFDLLEVQDGVFVNWQIDSGYTCQGVDILRSENGVDFVEVGHISGVCGSLTKPVSYSFLDEEPIANEDSYYRLKINGYGFTEILSIHYIELSEEGLLIYPNPANAEDVWVRFNNSNQEEVLITVVSIEGQFMQQTITTSNEFQLSSLTLTKGMYLISIQSADGRINSTGKLVVY
jgi:hypothetical protein